MVRSRRMRPLVEIARNRELEAGRRLGVVQRRLEEAQAQLDELKRYRDEYAARLRGGASLTARELGEFRVFLQKLELAIEQQGKRVEEEALRLRQSRQTWLQRHQRTSALDKVLENYRDEERKEMQRREQRESDDRGRRGKADVSE